jgi:hypothetical protein
MEFPTKPAPGRPNRLATAGFYTEPIWSQMCSRGTKGTDAMHRAFAEAVIQLYRERCMFPDTRNVLEFRLLSQWLSSHMDIFRHMLIAGIDPQRIIAVHALIYPAR